MPLLRTIAACLCACLCACLSGVPAAAQGPPRFTLPDPPFDYAIEAPIGVEHLTFPSRNEPGTPEVQNARAALGRVLFYERLLSRNRKRSCASCHRQERAFADGRRLSRGFAGQPTRRNSMSIVNLAFHRGPLFWDGRAATLEQLVLAPIEDPIEMGMTLEAVIERLRSEPGYAPLFERAFGTTAITEERIATALASFVRAIVSVRSRYDEGLAAVENYDVDFPNFTDAENRGKALFFNVGGSPRESCAGCHAVRAPTTCGSCWAIHPSLLQSEACRNNGIDRGAPDDDPGLGAVTDKPEDRGKFRAPSLRNVAVTGPYMHDGRFETLEGVVEFYARRMQPHPQLDPVFDRTARPGGGWSSRPAATQPAGFASIVGPQPGVPMERGDIADLVAFLGTLTDRSLLEDPRFADPFAKH